MSQIHEFYKVRIEPIMDNRIEEHKVFNYITRLVSAAHAQNMQSDESYCYKFSLPILAVNRLYEMLKIVPAEVKYVFEQDWGKTLTAMHKDSYYQILLLILYHAILKDKESLARNTFMLVLIKIWNGRKAKFFPKYCKKEIMKYVVNKMVTNRHVVGKYENPASLLNDYFVPTILQKYSSEVKKDPAKLKRLFEQSYARVYQIFAFNARLNLKTGASEASGGLLPLYMKAEKENLHVSATSTKLGPDEEESGFSDYILANNREEIVNTTTDFIVLNNRITYPINLINEINRKTHISTKVINQMLMALNKQKYYDLIKNIIIIFLARINLSTKDDICSPKFSEKIQKSIISSKNNAEMQKMHKLLDLLVTKIFSEELQLDYNRYSIVYKMKIKNVIILSLEHTLYRVNCRGV